MLVSIIIPIYNVASYITECIQSVMRQTYRNIEVLLVDDCGTDESVVIAKSMLGDSEDAVIDGVHYIILHHTQNRGLSAARNTGINASCGDWLFFLDSDDWISANCIETLVSAVTQEEGIEMAIGQLDTFDDNGQHGVKMLNGIECPKLNLVSGVYSEDILHHYLAHEFYEMAWNKLIHREFLIRNYLYFQEGLIHEDSLWSFCCACQLRKISVVSQTLYYYRIQTASIMAHSSGEKRSLALNSILCGQIDYVNTHRLGKNRQVFDYLFPRIKGYFFSPLYQENAALASDLYDKLYHTHFWSYRHLWYLIPAKRDFFPYLYRVLPKSIGLWFYSKVGSVLWKL